MINVSCFYYGNLGAQKHAWNFVRNLQDYENVALYPWDDKPKGQRMSGDTLAMLQRAESPEAPAKLGIGIGNINMMDRIAGSDQIAYVVWETTKIPSRDLVKLDGANKIWTPSTWGKSILIENGLSPSKVSVVPEGVNTQVYKPLKSLNIGGSQPFRVLFVGKWEKRKGLDLLVNAYAQAFDKSDSVELILQSSTAGASPKQLAEDLQNAIGLPVISGAPLSERALVHLYNYCDVLVLPTRAEGWGLPLIEAMACAKPVITTNYSAHLDYVNEGNAYLIDVKDMVEVRDEQYYSTDGSFGEWAEPDEAHLAHLLRHVYTNRDEARERGQKARQDVETMWTWAHSVDTAWKEIQSHRAE